MPLHPDKKTPYLQYNFRLHMCTKTKDTHASLHLWPACYLNAWPAEIQPKPTRFIQLPQDEIEEGIVQDRHHIIFTLLHVIERVTATSSPRFWGYPHHITFLDAWFGLWYRATGLVCCCSGPFKAHAHADATMWIALGNSGSGNKQTNPDHRLAVALLCKLLVGPWPTPKTKI